MFTLEEHLENLIRHKELIKDAAILLGKRLMRQGRPELGQALIARGFAHDNSKFVGIEWQYLHAGSDVPKDVLNQAIVQHQCTNQHHPEYFGGLENMDEISVYEMVCDWYARSHEFGTNLRDWAKIEANGKYHIDDCPIQKKWIDNAVALLLIDSFVRE